MNTFADAVVDLVDSVTDAERNWDADRIEQVVHGDFWDDNVPFVGSRLEAILDFGFMAQRLRVDDLALTFWFYLLEPDHGVPGEAERRLLRTLMDAYDQTASQPLSLGERIQYRSSWPANRPGQSASGSSSSKSLPRVVTHST